MSFTGETSASWLQNAMCIVQEALEAPQQEPPQQPAAPQQPSTKRKRCSCQRDCDWCLEKPPTAPADPPASKRRKRVNTCWRERDNSLRSQCTLCENGARRQQAAEKRQCLVASRSTRQTAIEVASGLEEPIAALQHATRQLAAIRRGAALAGPSSGSPAAVPQPAVLAQPVIAAAQPIAAKPAALTTAAPAETAMGTGGSPDGSPGGSPAAAPQPTELAQSVNAVIAAAPPTPDSFAAPQTTAAALPTSALCTLDGLPGGVIADRTEVPWLRSEEGQRNVQSVARYALNSVPMPSGKTTLSAVGHLKNPEGTCFIAGSSFEMYLRAEDDPPSRPTDLADKAINACSTQVRPSRGVTSLQELHDVGNTLLKIRQAMEERGRRLAARKYGRQRRVLLKDYGIIISNGSMTPHIDVPPGALALLMCVFPFKLVHCLANSYPATQCRNLTASLSTLISTAPAPSMEDVLKRLGISVAGYNETVDARLLNEILDARQTLVPADILLSPEHWQPMIQGEATPGDTFLLPGGVVHGGRARQSSADGAAMTLLQDAAAGNILDRVVAFGICIPIENLQPTKSINGYTQIHVGECALLCAIFAQTEEKKKVPTD